MTGTTSSIILLCSLLCFVVSDQGKDGDSSNEMRTKKIVNVPIAVMLPLENVDNNCTHKAIEMAINDVNSVPNFMVHTPRNKSQTIEEYKFQPYYTYTSNSVGEAIEVMHSSFQSANIFATIGPPYKEQVEYCTEYTTANANIHISYSEANEPYERYFVMYHQTPPSISSSFSAAAHLLKTYNWRRAGLIYDYSDKRYRKNADKIRDIVANTKVGDTKIDILADQGIWSIPPDYNVTKELGDLQEKGIRIIVVLASVRGARKIFCEAYHRKMYRPKVIWIMFETLPEDWASDRYNTYETAEGPKREISCTEEQLHIAADGYISIIKKSIRQDDNKTISSMTSKQFMNRLQSQVKPGATCDEKVAYAYDSVWVLALGSQKQAGLFKFSDYNYENYQFSMIMSQYINSIQFESMTGNFRYDAKLTSSSRIGLVATWVNHKGQKPKHFADYDALTDHLNVVPGARKIVFGSEKGSIPKDRATYNISFEVFDYAVLTIMWLLAFAGVLLALVFLSSLIYLLRTRGRCLETPVTDFIILLGSILCYLSVIIYGVDTRNISRGHIPNVCTAFLWMLSLGFTLTFGGLFTKTWRIYKQYMTPDVKVVDATTRNSSNKVRLSFL